MHTPESWVPRLPFVLAADAAAQRRQLPERITGFRYQGSLTSDTFTLDGTVRVTGGEWLSGGCVRGCE